MLELIVLSIIVAIVVGLVLTLLGRVLASVGVPIAATIGGFFEQFAWGIGVLAGLYYFFTGGKLPW